MARFSPVFRAVMRHSVESAIYATFLLLIAFGLSFVEDYARSTHRPEWLVIGVSFLSIVAFIADGVAWGLLLFVGLKYLWKRFLQ